MNKLFGEIIGWYGMAVIVLAYALLSFHALTADNIIYQVLNFTGAIGIAIISFMKKAYQPAALNVTWTIIALVALIKIMF